MNLSDDESLQIQRLKRENPVPMGDPGTWTIFVYMCGTDLESENGLASMDLQEMVDASTGTNVRYVVQTGGTQAWDNDYTDTAVFGRYEISAGEIAQIGEQELISMGDSSALADFLKWGVTTYPAEKMGVILWNHGGGSITGICFDEMYDYDSLSLRELDAALLSVYDSMTDNFEFIGFDACLMSTIECANVLASYADYMYGSEETEPGYGWDYKEIGDYLGAHPEADGAQEVLDLLDQTIVYKKNGWDHETASDLSIYYPLEISVQACVYMLSADGADLIDLGQNAYINMDWQTGTFSDAFDGYWYSLPDGQNLAVYIVSENDGYDIYTSPVMVNGEETNLRITHDYVNGIITIDGTWDGIDENGMAAKEIREFGVGRCLFLCLFFP